jgi:hypothetical protein
MQITIQKSGLCALMFLGAVTSHLFGAEIGKGDIFGRAATTLNSAREAEPGPLSEAAPGSISAAVSRSSPNLHISAPGRSWVAFPPAGTCTRLEQGRGSSFHSSTNAFDLTLPSSEVSSGAR